MVGLAMSQMRGEGTMGKISGNTLGAIIALEAIILGIFVGLKMGFSFVPHGIVNSIATLGGNRHIVGTLAALVLIPILARQTRAGYLAVIGVVSVTAVLTLVTIADLLIITPGSEAKAPVPIAMLIFQVLAIVFSYRALKETAIPNQGVRPAAPSEGGQT
jgi:hypothetical protein